MIQSKFFLTELACDKLPLTYLIFIISALKIYHW